MLEVLPFIVLIIMRYHYHDEIPWYIWAVAIVVLFSNPVLRLKGDKE
jgi:hypothetical protein